MGANDIGAFGAFAQELVHLGDGPVVGRDHEPVIVHVQNQVLAHDGQADESDVWSAVQRHVGNELIETAQNNNRTQVV